MRSVFFFSAWCVAFIGAQAQTAQEIVDATSKTYRELTSYQVQAVTRSARLMPMPMPTYFGPASQQPQMPSTETVRYTMSSGRYVQFSLKLRKPDDWSLAVQTHVAAPPVRTSSAIGTRPGPAAPITTFESMARWGNQAPEFGKQQNDRFDLKGPPAADFGIRLKSLLSSNGVNELVVAQFEPPANGFETARPFTVMNPEFTEDSVKDPSLHVIRGKTRSGGDVVVWIDKATLLVNRTLIYTRESYSGQMGPMGSPNSQAAARTMVSIHEAVYRAQLANPAFQRTDFVLQTPSVIGPIDTTVHEWLPQQALLALTDEKKPAGQSSGDVSLSDTSSSAPAVATVAPVVVDAQALSHEQMSGIVLIEGDGGTGTGFMTKIRDLDFVVTNLHVLGRNKKISLKTLSGQEIPIQGIFGAAGSDIAIIRIGNGQGSLKLAEDVFKTSKIGDKVVVVGNRQGGGVATQTAGSILGVGPTRVEVNANFEPGNSGSPIVNLSTGEVVGVASYSETRRVEVDETESAEARANGKAAPAKVEKRWFGYRIDGITKWESIDLAKWNAQGARIEAFTEMSEALVAVLKLDFNAARRHPRLNSLIANFEAKLRNSGSNSVTAATAVKDLFYVIRSISEDGVRDLTNGDYYDYYRTCLYWEDSIPAQLDYRKSIVEVLKKYEANSAGYLSRMRGGN